MFAPLMPAVAFDQMVFDIQRALTDLGYDPGPVDGASGARTRRAIADFLAQRNLDPALDGATLVNALADAEVTRRSSIEAGLPAEIVVQIAGPVFSMDLSPDGRLLATAGDRVRLWDMATGILLRTLQGHTDIVTAVAFSPDGESVVSGSADKSIRFWDVLSGRQLRRINELSDSVTSIAFSPDGTKVVTGTRNESGGEDTVGLWDIASGQLLRTFPADFTNSVALSADGVHLITGGLDKTAKLWDVNSGQLLRVFEGHSGIVGAVAISLDGSRVLTGSWDGTARLWDGAGKQLHVFEGHSGEVTSVRFSPDGRHILTGSADATAKLWDVSGTLLRTLTGHGAAIYSAVFSADANILTASLDASVNLWDGTAGELMRKFEGHSAPIQSIDFSPDGRRILAAGDDGNVRTWDLRSAMQLPMIASHSSSVTAVAVSPDGRMFLTGSHDNIARVWNVDTGDLKLSLEGHLGFIRSVAFSPDDRLVLTGSDDDTVRLWDADSGKLLRTLNGPHLAIFSPGGERILTGSRNGIVLLWDTDTGQLLRTFGGQSSTILSIAFSPNGTHILAGRADAVVSSWDAESGAPLLSLRDAGSVQSVAFSPDGAQILTGSDDGAARLWNAATGSPIRTLKGHSLDVRSAVFSPDGRLILTASWDTTVGVWNTADGARLASMIALEGGEWITITPEGFFASSEHGAESLAIVRGLTGYSIDQAYQALYRPDLVQAKLAGDPDGLVAAAAAKLDLAKVIESGAAPRVMIANLTDGAVVVDESVDITASVVDQGGGIGKIEWRVNGITLGVEARGFDRLAVDAQAAVAAPVELSKTLSLDPGDNLIEVVAYNQMGLIASDPAAVTVTWDGASATTPPRLFVVSVGVNDYFDSRLQLTYAASDAKAIGAAFQTAGADLYESVEVTTVLDGDVTAANLDQVFSDLGAKVRPRDVFVLFMAGHGKTQDGRYYFLPSDFRYVDETSIAAAGIDQDQFQDWLARIPARKSVLLYDTCDSGALTNAATSRGLEEVAALARMTRAMGRTVLSASTDDAPALEGYNGHGVFTYALLQALGDGDANDDGTIEVTELAGAIDRVVPEISYAMFNLRQIPQMSIVGSDFPLAHKAQVLTTTTADSGEVAVPTNPTHVIIATVQAHETADATSDVVASLAPGTQVTMLKDPSGGYALIARGDAVVGFIEETALAPLQ
jgi:WD40 repeat protein